MLSILTGQCAASEVTSVASSSKSLEVSSLIEQGDCIEEEDEREEEESESTQSTMKKPAAVREIHFGYFKFKK